MKFVTLTIIASSEHEERLKAVAKEAGASGATVIQARGCGHEEKKSFFALTFEGNHSILLYVIEDRLSRTVLKAVKKEIETSATDCIAFTTPIGHLVGLNECTIKKFEENIKQEGVI